MSLRRDSCARALVWAIVVLAFLMEVPSFFEQELGFPVWQP